jgi:hypothetical protein
MTTTAAVNGRLVLEFRTTSPFARKYYLNFARESLAGRLNSSVSLA